MDFVENIRWDAARLLLWEKLDVGASSYHAALVAAESPTGFRIIPHRHDFFEIMLAVEGAGYHSLIPQHAPARTEQLKAGDLVFLRPDDCHAITIPAGSRLHWINVAFPAVAWEAFRIAADLSLSEWDTAPFPRAVHLEHKEQLVACTALFQGVLRRFYAERVVSNGMLPDRLDLCSFLTGVVRFLRSHTPVPKEQRGIHEGPSWLLRACRILQHEIDLDRGAGEEGDVSRLVSLSGVSPAHLARTIKTIAGITPTEYVNGLRLNRAALLLTTTARPIVDISAASGFHQLSYFYRLFRRRFGMPPDAYRRAALGPLTL